MNDLRFDTLSRALATGWTRRRVLQWVGSVAGTAAAVLNHGPAGAAPNSCAVFCADQPGARKASCRQACQQCGGDPARLCQDPRTAAFACCPAGQACTFPGICCHSEAGVCSAQGAPFCCPDGQECCRGDGGGGGEGGGGGGVCCGADDLCCAGAAGLFCASSLTCESPRVRSGCECVCGIQGEFPCPQGQIFDPQACACIDDPCLMCGPCELCAVIAPNHAPQCFDCREAVNCECVNDSCVCS